MKSRDSGLCLCGLYGLGQAGLPGSLCIIRAWVLRSCEDSVAGYLKAVGAHRRPVGLSHQMTQARPLHRPCPLCPSLMSLSS